MKFNISFELPSRNTYEYSLGELKVKMIKFNDVQMCPSEESAHKSHHRFTSAVVSGPRCVEFKKEGVTTGKWNGSLTVYPEKSANTMSVEIKLDVVGLSYGVTGIYNVAEETCILVQHLLTIYSFSEKLISQPYF